MKSQEAGAAPKVNPNLYNNQAPEIPAESANYDA